MNKYTFLFPDNIYGYDCSSCYGLCCNINGLIPLNNAEYKYITKNFTFCKRYITNKGGVYYLKTPKKCWFLNNNLCILKDKKPIACSLYPLKLESIGDNCYFVKIVPCPNFSEANIVSHKDASLISTLDKSTQFFCKTHKHTKEFEWIYNYVYQDLTPIDTNEKRIMFLFVQIIMTDFFYKCSRNEIKLLYKKYKFYVEKYILFIDNMQNIYILSKHALIDYWRDYEDTSI